MSSLPPPLPSSPPPLPPHPPAAGDAPPRKKRDLTLLIGGGLSVLLVLFIAFRVAQAVVEYRKLPPPKRSPAELALSKAKGMLGSTNEPMGYGNNETARELALQMAKHMKAARDVMFTHKRQNSFEPDSVKREEFSVFCQLNPDSCAFIVRVPDLRRFTSSAQESLAELAYTEACELLKAAKQEQVRKLGVATRGVIAYDTVLIGHYSSAADDFGGEPENVGHEGVLAPALEVFFESAVEKE